jgi:hypothetical protein
MNDATDVFRHTPVDEQIVQTFETILARDPLGNVDRQALPSEPHQQGARFSWSNGMIANVSETRSSASISDETVTEFVEQHGDSPVVESMRLQVAKQFRRARRALD